MKIKKKTWLLSIKIVLVFALCLTLEYPLLRYLSVTLDDKEIIGYFSSAVNTFLMASVSIFVLLAQIITNHNQFTYIQKKNDISTIIELSIKYLNMYKIDNLKQLLYNWQYNINSRENLYKKLEQLKEEAYSIWLRFSFEINPDDNVSIEFLSNQTKNFKVLCDIFEDLKNLFSYSYSNLRDTNSEAYKRMSESGSRLAYCLNEKLLVKAVFEDYDISYSRVKGETNEYLNKLKLDLTDTLKVYG